MEWREQSNVSCDAAFLETQRWVQAVTKKTFGRNNFRSALENGVLLCDLINRIEPGIIKRVNRLSTPIAGLDNINVFLKACGKLGLKEAQLFHPGDLQDTSTRVTVKHQETSRRLKNVLITLYWLGRKTQSDPFFDGPNLNLNAFEGLLGITALAKALEESPVRRASSGSIRERDSGFGESWCSDREKEDIFPSLRGVHRRENSFDSLESLGSRPHSRSSDNTLKGSSEGCGSDAEADSDFRMSGDSSKDSLHYRRSLVIAPKTAAQFNQFLPTRDKPAAYVPAPLRKKRAERNEENRRSWASPMFTEEDGAFTRSKSMTDLGVETAALKQVQYEELQKMREMVKETEDQWQDDLNKWKNRRKSVNSDIVKKKEEREQIEQTTVSSSFQRSSRSSIGSRLNSLASLDQDVFEDSTPIIRPRTLHARSYTIDSSYISPRDPSPTPPTLPRAKEENPVPTYTTTTNRDISPSMDDMSDSATNSDSDTDSVGPTPNYNPLIPTPSEKAPSPASRYTSAAKMEEPSSATSGTNQTSNYIPRVPTLRTNENAPCPPPWCPSAARTEKTSIVTTDFGRASKYNPHVLAPTPSEKASTPAAKVEETSSASTAAPSNLLPKVTESRLPWEGKGAKEVTPSIGAGSLCKPPEHNYVAMETKYIPPVVSRVSSSLPRGYVRSDSARLTSVITARPFGNQSSRVASLPRAYTMDDSYKRVNGETEVSKKPLAPSRYSQVITSEDEAHSSSPHSSGGEEDEGQEEAEKNIQMGRGVTPTLAPSLVLAPVRSISPIFQPPKVAFPENYSDMRISLNQKPNQSKDFGFQTKWDSTGVCVTSIQPGSSAEMCQLQVGDKVLSVSGRSVDKMSFSEWTSSQELALRKGSLTMDLRRHGRKSSPDMTTVNATTTSLDFTSRGSMEPTKELPNKPIIDVASNGLKGGFREETVISRNIESVEPISLKNLKRRSEFFEQGGSESTISDIPVPPITSTSDRWTWDGEAERRRQEKWQQEQERILQEKYRFDQKKLEEEWRRAQREAGTDGESYNNAPQEPKDLQVENRSRQFSPASPCQPALTREDQEEEIRKKREEENERKKCVEEENERKKRVEEENERKKRVEEENERKKRVEEENERKKRVEENERKKRVEEEHRRGEEERRKERELLRLQEEKQEDEKRRKQREEELRWQRRKEEEREESRRQEAEQQRREQERKQEQQQWEKSKSIPDIDDMEKSETTGWYKGSGGMAQRLLEEELRRKADKNAQGLRAASELELERRNILNAMKYREPERVASSGGLGEASWRKGQQTLSQAELERQQILQEMKKTTQLSTDNSWIRPSSISTDTVKDHTAGLVRRGESLDNLDANPRSSWRSSWTPGSTSSISTYSMPSNISGLNTTSFSGGAGYSDNGVGSRPGSATLPSSHSMSSLKGNGGSNPSSWSQHSSSSPSPIPSPGLESESRLSTQQRNRSVSGKKICTFCDTTLGKGAAMIIESLGLCYHLTCFKCMDCKSDLGGSEAGAEVRIRNRQLYCNSCYMRFKTGQVKM